MLKVENASIVFGKDVLFSGLSFQVNPGELICITGESGRGKTSLLRSILGFVPLQTGKITLDEMVLNYATVDLIRKKIAWMPQELALPTEWVKDMVRIPFDLKINRGVNFTKGILMDYFKKLGLEEDLYDKRVNEISGGQRQRVMLAVSALTGRSLLMIDEPTSALDAFSCSRVLDFLHWLISMNIAVLAVSHDKKFIDGCNRKIIL